MYLHLPENRQKKNRQADNQNSLGVFQLKDQRPQAIEIQRLQQIADNSHLSRRLKHNNSQTDTVDFPSIIPLQRAVVPSGTYTTVAANRNIPQTNEITQEWQDLDDLVEMAEENAETGVAEILATERTATQNAYALNPTAALWGSCVEEQLNALADPSWEQQVQLPGSRPDYGKMAGGIQIYADLTTPAEAGMAGNHITGKLMNSQINAGNAVAADITYGGNQADPADVEPWRIAAFNAQQRHFNARNENGDYNPWAEKNMFPSNATIWNWDQEECEEYTRVVNLNIPLVMFEAMETSGEYDDSND